MNGDMTWGLVITSPAKRGLRRASRSDRERINEAFSAMCTEPFSGDTKLLRGTDGAYRRRVGDWRIFFELDEPRKLVVILAVKRRASNTY